MIEVPVLDSKTAQTYIGAWVCNPTHSIRTLKKPCWLKRVVVKFFLGWDWVGE